MLDIKLLPFQLLEPCPPMRIQGGALSSSNLLVFTFGESNLVLKYFDLYFVRVACVYQVYVCMNPV